MSTLALNKHTPVDASAGPVPMALPTGAASGDEVSAEKYDATTNTVTITGNIRGVDAQTITLSLPHEIIAFRADSGGSWWPVGDHKTLASINALIAAAVSAAGVASAAAAAVTAALASSDVITGSDLRVDHALPTIPGFSQIETDQSTPPNVIAYLAVDGTRYISKLSSPSIPLPEGNATIGSDVPLASSFVSIDQDSSGNVIMARRADGSYYFDRATIRLLDAPAAIRTKSIACFGDSMFQDQGGLGTTTPAQIAANLPGVTVFNGGVSGQTSTEIALRTGALDVWFVFSGGQIPADTSPVALTAVLSPAFWKTGSSWDFAGSFLGVPGTLHKDAADAWTFARTTAGSVVTVPVETRWQSTFASYIQNGWGILLRGGRNDVSTTIVPRDLRYVREAVNNAQPRPRFLQIPLYNNATETSGSSGYNNVMAINASLEVNAGPDFYDLRGWLIRNGLAVMGIAPTTADTTAIGQDCIPPSLMYDDTHLNVAGRTAEGIRLAYVLTEKGWFA